mgnify:CR=1 FL=1
MYRFFSMFAVALTLALPATAQETGSYLTFISANDIYNSSGTRLTTVGAIIQQDRANYHRFGIPDADDNGDPWFGNAALRATLSGARISASNDGSIGRILEGRALVVVYYQISNGAVTDLAFVTPG